jgi:NAD(P)-dependent dehydrogenase (short-subunit alcohol dehydrogenase family)
MIYSGKVALVTGGASGIGRAAAIGFARDGACVTVADRDRSGGEAVVKQIIAAGGRAIFVETDVTSEAAIKAMIEKTVAEFGGLDAAYNNVGTMGNYSTAVTCTMEEWDSTFRLNMTSIWLCMKYEIPEMIKRGGGAIVNAASRAGDSAVPNIFSYVSTKHGVIGMTRSAAVDFAAQNIRVNALLPGFIDTQMLHGAATGAGMPPMEGLAQAMVPLKRLGQPQEPAEAVIWLCSDRASYVTGTCMITDGGLSACV